MPLAATISPTRSSQKDTDIKSYGNRLSTVKSVSKGRTSNCGSRRAGTPSRAGTKTASRAGSRAGSTGSAAAKLQLMLEEAENEAEEEFHRTMTARDLRRLNRDQVRVREQNERQEQERQRDLEREEFERQRDLEREEFERKRERDRRDEERRKDIERRNEQLEMERNRIMDKAEDREELMKRRKAGVKAKQRAIARFEEERKNDLASEVVKRERSVSSPPSEAEVSSIEKVAAYIGDIGGESNTPNQQSGGYGSEMRGQEPDKINTDELISQSKALIDESRNLISRGQAIANRSTGAIESRVQRGKVPISEGVETSSASGKNTVAVKKNVIVKDDRIAAVYPKIDSVKVLNNDNDINNRNEALLLHREGHGGERFPPRTYSTPGTHPHHIWNPDPGHFRAETPNNTPNRSASTVNPLVDINKKVERLEIPTLKSSREPYIPDDYHPVEPPKTMETQQPSWRHDQPSYSSNTRNADRVIDAVCAQMALSRLPAIEPEVFDGKDPLSFPIWLLSFEALVGHRAMTDVDRLSVLNKYLGGEAKRAIRGYLLLPPSEAYSAAYRSLVMRYGDNYRLAKAYRDRLASWPKIGG